MKKNIALMVLILFVMGNIAYASSATTGKTTMKAKTKIVKMEKAKSGKMMVKTAPKAADKKDMEKKPVKRSFLKRVWHKLFGWTSKKSAEQPMRATPAPKKK
jgi:hypothetical protein